MDQQFPLRQGLRAIICATLLAACLTSWSVPLTTPAMAEAEDIWLAIDTRGLTLSVMQGDTILKTYENIAIGSNGATRDKRARDEKTPLGEFRINAVRDSRRFHLFLSIDYPSMEHARRALADERIDSAEYAALSQAWDRGEEPPQDTGLGGHLGIHGIGSGSLEIHNNFNWTDGCIAITNEQVEELAAWVRVGTLVSIAQQPVAGMSAAR